MADLNSLFRDHQVTLRTNAKNAGVDLDATTIWIKNIPTIRAGVVVPDCDINTEMAVYITANYP